MPPRSVYEVPFYTRFIRKVQTPFPFPQASSETTKGCTYNDHHSRFKKTLQRPRNARTPSNYKLLSIAWARLTDTITESKYSCWFISSECKTRFLGMRIQENDWQTGKSWRKQNWQDKVKKAVKDETSRCFLCESACLNENEWMNEYIDHQQNVQSFFQNEMEGET